MRSWFIVAGLGLIAAAPAAVDVERGRELFGKRFTPAEGLGPRYNAESCADCHAAMGGAGDLAHNVRFEGLRMVPRFDLVPRDPVLDDVLSGLMRPDPERHERNTPALWGAGRIDDISDAAIRANTTRGEISGRPARSRTGHVGRFGRRGSVSDLIDFTSAACAGELGLSTPSDAVEEDATVELSEADVRALAGFVADLPAPRFDVERRGPVAKGAATFAQIGCASCHVADLDGVEGLYSDLLLHDMGRALAASGTGGYLAQDRFVDGDAGTFNPLPSEWLTPPLWGVADSGPWLHDGRAATLEDAILAHDGEAARVRSRFAILEPDSQADLLAFLGAMRAPGVSSSFRDRAVTE